MKCLGSAKFKFIGFKNAAYGEFKNWGEEYDKTTTKIETNTIGYNWGNFNVKNACLEFQVQDKPVFEIPYSSISQSVIQGKQEVALEFHQDDTTNPEHETLIEMRIWVPEDENSVRFKQQI